MLRLHLRNRQVQLFKMRFDTAFIQLFIAPIGRPLDGRADRFEPLLHEINEQNAVPFEIFHLFLFLIFLLQPLQKLRCFSFVPLGRAASC